MVPSLARHASPDASGEKTVDDDLSHGSLTQGHAEFQQMDLARLVERVRAGDRESILELYEFFRGPLYRYYLKHVGPQDVEDKIHDTYLILLGAIQRGAVRHPERLCGFVRTIMRRTSAAFIRVQVTNRNSAAPDIVYNTIRHGGDDPEVIAARNNGTAIILRALSALSERDREVLTRFYIEEQSAEQIREELNLTETQYRLIKSRAKNRFANLAHRQLRARRLKFIAAAHSSAS